ncbi:MAG: serine/threonine protein phosphatase [Chitinophagaceae bacterium]|nr:MAG: serine/threonine protein phosphatase [Chitinophagaceae bacterium]
MARTIAIGDIHGAVKALTQVIDLIKPGPGDEFIFMGDYVDGWPDSAEVVDFLIQFQKTNRCVFIRGNHDVWCELWLQGNKPDTIWLQHGGKATIESYGRLPDESRYEHLEFFAQLENYKVDAENRLFTHAGYSTLEGPAYEFRDGQYSWDRSLWETAFKMQQKQKETNINPADYPKKFQLYKEIYIGHTPTIFYNIATPVHALNIWNTDTGAGFDGKLSAIEINSQEIWQSDPVPELYPGITGRAR